MARSIMIQGTMSNAGKSLIAAGLCRIFAQDGYKTAPFKSQNMALNSFITEDGLEMGRAQVVQAEAAGVKPSADMNPILLKPTTDVGSQVIVNGVSIGNMRAKDYFAYKKQLIPQIMEAYKRLDEAYDVIVIEGAGSPAEINLKSDDIVNMGLAAMVDAPVLLAGDIDRGGVFAQLYGTVELLEPEERNRIKGLIINKFRGDKSILEPGLRQLEDLCKIPVAGVVPYMNVDIEDEDSLSSKLGNTRQKGCIDIAVIRFPKISNFTDMDVFERMDEVSVRYVSKPSELKTPDMVILPGTKNTIDDLLWMRQNGLEAAILKLAARQVPVWGICGGFQMMGEWLVDEHAIESSHKGKIHGMGLFPVETEFEEEKVRTQTEGRFGELYGCFRELSGKRLTGYEIHMGRTKSREKEQPLCLLNAGESVTFIARRIMICAAEDVGLADPQALVVAVSAAEAVHQLGMPEARIPLAEAVLYIANAPKGNAAYMAIDKALDFVKREPAYQIPAYLKDAHYGGAKELGHGIGYKYPHDYEGHYVEQQYLPDEIKDVKFFEAD